MAQRTAIIAGAGVAGLAAAWWLDRIGWKSVVVERAETLRDGGYMLGLSGPGHQTAMRMGLLPALEAVSYAIHENVYRDTRGKEILRLRYRDFLVGLPYLAVRRTDLVRIIREALPASVEIRLGRTVAAVDEEGGAARVRLDDGTMLSADLVIGADGFRSQFRRQFFGADEGFLEPLGYRFATYDLDDPLGLGVDFLSYAEPGHVAEFYQLQAGALAGLHIWRDPDAAPVAPEARWDRLRAVARTSNRQVHDIIERAAASSPAPLMDSLTLVAMPRWHEGRILLLGDSAHCMTLISGQGAGMAMASAEILAQELARADVPEALEAHHRRLAPAIAKLHDRSRKMAKVFVPESGWGFALRNLVLRHMPRKWLGRYFLNAIRSEIALVGNVDA